MDQSAYVYIYMHSAPSDRDPLLRMQDRIRPNASPALAARPHATY